MNKAGIIRVFRGFQGKLKSIQENHRVKAVVLLIKDHQAWISFLILAILSTFIMPPHKLESLPIEIRRMLYTWTLIFMGYILGRNKR